MQGKPGTMMAVNYLPVLLTMVVLLIIGFIATTQIRPVASKYHEPETELSTTSQGA